MASLGGGGGGGAKGTGRVTPVGGHRIITGLIPAAVIPDEILTDHPKRFRAMVVESSQSRALARRQRAHARGTRRARARRRHRRRADRDRPARRLRPARPRRSSRSGRRRSSRSSSPTTSSTCAADPRPAGGHAAGARDPPPARPRARRATTTTISSSCTPPPRPGRAAYADAFLRRDGERRSSRRLAPVVLYETLGPVLARGTRPSTAVLWGLAHTCFLIVSRVGAARRLRATATRCSTRSCRRPLAASRSPSTSTTRPGAGSHTPDGRVNLAIAELLARADRLARRTGRRPAERFPFVLSAGERRSSTANTIFRDPRGGRRTPTARCA